MRLESEIKAVQAEIAEAQVVNVLLEMEIEDATHNLWYLRRQIRDVRRRNERSRGCPRD